MDVFSSCSWVGAAIAEGKSPAHELVQDDCEGPGVCFFDDAVLGQRVHISRRVITFLLLVEVEEIVGITVLITCRRVDL